MGVVSHNYEPGPNGCRFMEEIGGPDTTGEYQICGLPPIRHVLALANLVSFLGPLAKICGDTARGKGWWDPEEKIVSLPLFGGPQKALVERSFGDMMALVHSEASEALEEYRNGHAFDEVYWSGEGEGPGCTSTERTEAHQKPEGIPIELADIIIRVLDIAHNLDVDIAAAVLVKMEYNATRPHRHGGKKL